MGIDLSVTVGVGTSIGTAENIVKQFPEFEEDPDGVLYNLLRDEYPLLDYIRAGSEWTGTSEYVLVLRSHMLDFDPEEDGGGLYYLNEAEVTIEEYVQITNAYFRLTGEEFVGFPKPFVGLHVY